MKITASAPQYPARRRARGWVPGLCLFLAFAVIDAMAQPKVETIAGASKATPAGPFSGSADGGNFTGARFNSPSGIAVDLQGNLIVADTGNGKVRKIFPPTSAGQTITLLSGLTGVNTPMGVAVDRWGTLYVLTKNHIRSYDTNLNFLKTNVSGLVNATAFAMDGSTNFYVSETNASVLLRTIKRFAITNSAMSNLVVTNFVMPMGVAILDSGRVVVSDAGANAIKFFDPTNKVLSANVLAGGSTNGVLNGAGFIDGPGALAAFRAPQGIAKAPNGSILVADRDNHRVRLVKPDGYTSTFYGVSTNYWTNCTTCSPMLLRGWVDGTVDLQNSTTNRPAARSPQAVVVTPSGDAFTAENYYHIIRRASGGGLATGGGGGGGTTNAVAAPVFTPNSGYFPNGQTIFINSTLPDVFYTMDGTVPTTNSLRVSMVGNLGSIRWANSTNDLTALQVRAYDGTNASAVVAGIPSTVNSIGIPSSVNGSYVAGAGSTMMLPLVVNLTPGVLVQSVSYYLSVSWSNGKPINNQFKVVALTTNDFIPVAGLVGANLPIVDSGTGPASRYIVVAALGNALGGQIQNFGVLNLISIPIPANAANGDTYTITVSATALDGAGRDIPLFSSGTTIQVGNPGYMVGNVVPRGWYNAGEFGDTVRTNNNLADVNAIYMAALGIRIPPMESDAYNAMDVFPEDGPGIVGGDGDIRFLDWKTILRRVYGLNNNTNLWREWSGGSRVVTNLAGASKMPRRSPALPLGEVWSRQVQMIGDVLGNVAPGQTVLVPISATIASGKALTGLLLRTAVEPVGSGPAVTTPVTFVPAQNQLYESGRLEQAQAYAVWSQFAAPLIGSNLLGYVQFQVPLTAPVGQAYRVRLPTVSGGNETVVPAEDPAIETLPGLVYVGVAAPAMRDVISDEWKVRFFGSVDSTNALWNADPDHDGVPNWLEYLMGTNPMDNTSKLQMSAVPTGVRTSRNVVLRWLSAPQKSYTIESLNQPFGGWNTVSNVIGSGDYQQVLITDTNRTGTRFFRIKVNP
ncbi:MAG: chitobiase/beta-hexosaminidase C-terminal domain-containing protein [Verrucomicrobiota bacterium]